MPGFIAKKASSDDSNENSNANSNANSYSAVQRALKLIGIGKKGSQSIPADLIEELRIDLKRKASSSLSVAALFAGLLFRLKASGLSEAEFSLFSYIDASLAEKKSIPFSREAAAQFLSSLFQQSISPYLFNLALGLLEGKHFSRDEAENVAEFIFSRGVYSKEKHWRSGEEAFSGFVLAYLRIRYESLDEFCGFYDALNKRLCPLENHHLELAVFSEPLNGYTHSFFLSPLIAAELRRRYPIEAAHQTGRNPGPKFHCNLRDIQSSFNWASFLPANSHSYSYSLEGMISSKRVIQPVSLASFGKVFPIETASPDLDSWVERRWDFVKRPCLATLEKFINPFRPCKAKYLISSAFHPPYLQKMLAIAQYAGFEGILIASRGAEGGLTASHRGLVLTAAKKRKFYKQSPQEDTASVSRAKALVSAKADVVDSREFHLDFEAENTTLQRLNSEYETRQFRFLRPYSADLNKKKELMSPEQNIAFLKKFSLWEQQPFGQADANSFEDLSLSNKDLEDLLIRLDISVKAYVQVFDWLLR